jgi:hypothetical protein
MGASAKCKRKNERANWKNSAHRRSSVSGKNQILGSSAPQNSFHVRIHARISAHRTASVRGPRLDVVDSPAYMTSPLRGDLSGVRLSAHGNSSMRGCRTNARTAFMQ